MSKIPPIIAHHRPDLAPYEALYKHLHANPELSFQEHTTAATLQENLRTLASSINPDLTLDIHPNIGNTTGLAAVLRNGPGPTVLLRADIDALPVEEKTGLPYASKARQNGDDGKERPVMHACGHDFHMTALLAAVQLLISARHEWRGTVVSVWQPAEELGKGAQALVDGGLYDVVPRPDVVVGGHVAPLRAGRVGSKRGLMASAADSYNLAIHGRSGHASQPHRTIDPILTAASTITRLQTIVAREVDPNDHAVVTVGYVHAGDAVNIIPARADLGLDIRTVNDSSRTLVLDSVRRIVRAEAEASGAETLPEFTPTRNFPFLVNDESVTAKLEETFKALFGDEYDSAIERLSGSEDCGILATSIGVPATFFVYGGTDPELWDRAEKEGRIRQDVPINHSAYFAPVIQPTLRTGVDGYAGAALTWLLK